MLSLLRNPKRHRETRMNFEDGISKEWVLGNGLGGYSSSTIIGCNTRKYHGLLVAAIEPPLKRKVLLSKLEEEVECDGKRWSLSTNEYVGGISPHGHEYMRSFKLDLLPVSVYDAGGVSVEKTISTVRGCNAVVVSYAISGPEDSEAIFKVRPFITSRGIHEIGCKAVLEISHGRSYLVSCSEAETLAVKSEGGVWHPSKLGEAEQWYRNFHFRSESERGYPSVEDLLCPGEFNFKADAPKTVSIIAAAGKDTLPPESIFRQMRGRHEIEKNQKRLRGITADFRSRTGINNHSLELLALAADSVIVKRIRPSGRSILAGYHWFSDFGRDVFISLPGLSLVTGRFKDARDIILSFSRHIAGGLVPNNFSEDGQPHFGGVDASLWFLYAVQKYLQYTGDIRFVEDLKETMESVINGFIDGNRFASADKDGLISITDRGHALTWMDVDMGGHQPTPRYGKVIEINALWYNALRFLSGIGLGEEYSDIADKAQTNFSKFWNEESSCMFDFVSDDIKEGSIRPNQIFAVSMPYTPIGIDMAEKIVDRVKEHLLTPYGLRSLSPKNSPYKTRYMGDSISRDLAYHQGTVWSWLIGPFITAYVRVSKGSKQSRKEAEEFLAPLLKHVDEVCVGSVSEIFDGSAPHLPRGCVSQAWSVAEILRSYYEDVLNKI